VSQPILWALTIGFDVSVLIETLCLGEFPVRFFEMDFDISVSSFGAFLLFKVLGKQ